MNYIPDPMTPFTRLGFCEHVRSVAYHSIQPDGILVHRINDQIYLPYWWTDYQIHVAWEVDVPNHLAELIARIADAHIQVLWGERFSFSLLGADEGLTRQLDMTSIAGQVNVNELFSLIASDRRDQICKWRQHGVIYITARSFLNSPLSWSNASFTHGAIVFALLGQKSWCYDAEFMDRLIRHETTHLCGLYTHCRSYQAVEGWPYDGQCLMEHNLPTDRLCSKCLEYIRVFWEQVQTEYCHHNQR